MSSGIVKASSTKTIDAAALPTSGAENTAGNGVQHHPSQATQLVGLAVGGAKFFHSSDMVAYATVDLGDHRETHPLRSQAFRHWIARAFYEQHARTPSVQAFTDALSVLEGRALFDGKERPVFTRLGEGKGSYYLDLGNPGWEAVKINSHGWEIITNPLVRFCRPRGMTALPSPVSGGSLDDLRRFVNVGSEEDWILLVAWLLGTLRPRGPYPVLILH